MRFLLLASLLGGCTLYDSKGSGGSSGDDGPDVPGGGGSGPIGSTFVLSRSVIDGTPCGFSEETAGRLVEIESATLVLVEQDVAQGVVVQAAPANEGAGDPPNVRFRHEESWRHNDGGESAFPSIETQLWVDGATVTGRAQTSFQFVSDGTPITCTYDWILSG